MNERALSQLRAHYPGGVLGVMQVDVHVQTAVNIRYFLRMSSLMVLVIFIGVPAYVGYYWPSYAAFLVPLFLLALSIAAHVDNLSGASHPDDEVDGINGIYFVANAAGFVLCAFGVALGKRREDTGR